MNICIQLILPKSKTWISLNRVKSWKTVNKSLRINGIGCSTPRLCFYWILYSILRTVRPKSCQKSKRKLALGHLGTTDTHFNCLFGGEFVSRWHCIQSLFTLLKNFKKVWLAEGAWKAGSWSRSCSLTPCWCSARSEWVTPWRVFQFNFICSDRSSCEQ